MRYTGLQNKKILVVEDVELNQYLARHIMESWGCEVEIVENGALALERVLARDYDLVLMDIQMPVMDGVEATRNIRQMKDEAKSSVPIVALTANATKSERKVYFEVGMNDCMLKPFEEPALYDMVSRNIRKDKIASSMESMASRSGDETTALVAELPPRKYDLAMVEAVSGGDREFIKRMIDLFLETIPGALGDIRSAVDRQEWQLLSKYAHKLKSTIDSMGIAELKQDIREIEAGGKTGNDPEMLRSLSGKVITLMEEVMGQVKRDHK